MPTESERGEIGRHLIDQRWRHAGFVALQIDDESIGLPTALPDHLSDPIGPALVVRSGHGHVGPELATDIGDALIVGGDHHLSGSTGSSALQHATDQGHAANVEQWLARQPAGAVPRRDDDLEHAAQDAATSSSGASARASSSSMTGMASRTG
jgi:hypothetical protein